MAQIRNEFKTEISEKPPRPKFFKEKIIVYLN